MIIFVDPSAIGTFVAAIYRCVVRAAYRILTIERLGKSPSHCLQLKRICSGEKIRVPEAILLQAALEQAHDLRLFWEVAEHDNN